MVEVNVMKICAHLDPCVKTNEQHKNYIYIKNACATMLATTSKRRVGNVLF
jgi:hypothetical protein